MRVSLFLCLVAVACKPEPVGLPLLGAGSHLAESVTMTDVLTSDDELDQPRDIAFHPDMPDQAWILNRADRSVLIVDGIGTGDPTVDRRRGDGGEHFLSQPVALAFGDDGAMATIAEEDEPTQGNATPADFMGPTLWTSDPDVFDAGAETHLDMLHNSPDGMGIAWERDNAYWVFDGDHGSLTRYDFGSDHGLGGQDHSDGEVARYVEGEVARVPDESSNLAFDAATGLLYVADTGNHRIAVLDTATGEPGDDLNPNYDGDDQYVIDGAVTTTLVTRGSIQDPTGLELHDGMLWVSDFASGKVLAFNLDGTLVDWLETGITNGLQGMAFDDAGKLYVVDSSGDRIVQIAALPSEE